MFQSPTKDYTVCLPFFLSLLTLLCSCGHRGCWAKFSEKAGKYETIGASLISHDLSRARRLIMDNWRVYISKGEPCKRLLQNYRQALCTTNLGFQQDARRGETCQMTFYLISLSSFSRDSVSHNWISVLSLFSFSTEGLIN